MSGKKVLIFGCGGCLTIVLITGVLIGLFAFNLSRQFQQFGEDVQAMERTMQHLREAHPFEPPEDGVIAPARFNAYLDIRDAVAPSADAKLGWLVRFADDSGSASTFTVIYNFIRLVFTMMSIQNEIVDLLDEREMSLEEYSHYTVQTAAQLNQWSQELGEDDAVGQVARDYFEPLSNLTSAMENTGASAGELDAINEAVFLNRLNRASLNADNAGLIRENHERFTRSRAMVFMDSWIVNFDISEWRHEMDFHTEDAGDIMDYIPNE